MKTIKERAFEVVRAMKSTQRATIEEGEKVAWDLLQEIANAPELEPVAYQVRNGWVNVAIYQRQIDAENYAKDQQKRHDLSGSLAHFCVVPLYTAPPAPSVLDEFYNAVTNLSVELEELVAETSGVYGLHQNGDLSPWAEILEGGRFERISSLHVVQNLLAAQQPAQQADLMRDAERYRWVLKQAWFQSAVERFDFEDGGMQNRFEKCVDDFVDAAIERDKPKGCAA